MARTSPRLSQTLRLKQHIAGDNLQLKLIPLAPPGIFPPGKRRELEASIAF